MIPVEVFISDYKEVDGILIPHKAILKALGLESILTIERVEHNVNMPEDIFRLPDEIRALLDN